MPVQICQNQAKHSLVNLPNLFSGLQIKYIINFFNGKFAIESQLGLGTLVRLTLADVSFNQTPVIVLLDNDELTRMNWEYRARKSKINFKVYSTKIELLKSIEDLPKNTIFYIDSDLGTERGEDVAKFLHDQGYLELFMATGYDKSKFSHLSFIRGVIDKNPPF